MRAVPSGLGTTVDRLRTIRISRTDYDADADQLTLEPETPIPTLEAALAREEAGLNRPDLPVRVLSTVPVLIITRTKR